MSRRELRRVRVDDLSEEQLEIVRDAVSGALVARAAPDRTARKVMARIAREVDEIDEGLFERYEEAVAEHDALHAFVARFEEVDGDA
jgi:predicted phage gp36 major capsid-like protein